MKHLWILALCLVSTASFAASVEDVQIWGAEGNPGELRLMLHSKKLPKDSYFYVTITKDDPEAFGKMSQVTQKLVQGDKYRLDLQIVSFSAAPSGSSYRSPGIVFGGSALKK